MLTDVGVKYVILGHSETRGRFGVPEEGVTEEILRYYGETDTTVNMKAKAALAAGLTPIICVGETSEERAGRARRTSSSSAKPRAALDGITAEQVASQVVFAYEPVWAIGTGATCAADEADRVCGVVRTAVRDGFGMPLPTPSASSTAAL